MKDISRFKKQLHEKQRDLRRLLHEWNPIGVEGLPEDEYDSFFGIIGMLYRGASERELQDHIAERMYDFGLEDEPVDPRGFASRVFAWYWKNPIPESRRPGTSS